MNYFMLMGLIAGSNTDPPALAYSNQTAGNNAPAVGYSTVYPVSMFLRILTAQLLILILQADIGKKYKTIKYKTCRRGCQKNGSLNHFFDRTLLLIKRINMISVDGLTVEFGGTTLFSDISFQINEKDRIALMGKNGAGQVYLIKDLGWCAAT